MKGSPAKLGTIHGTSGHASALKMRSDKVKAAKKAGKKAKTLDDYIKEGFTPKDALQMMKDGATTGRTPDKAKKSTVAVDGQLNDAQKEYETDKKLLAKKKSPAKQVTDPKKKKTEKTYPKGYTEKDIKFLKEQNEDVVRYEDLDAKGRAIWKKQGKPIPKKKSPMKSHKKGHKDQQGPIPEKNPKLRKSEMEGTWVYPGKGTKSKFVTSERMNDLEERSSFIDEDVHSSGKKKTKQQKKDQAFLKRESDIIRDRTRNQKKYKGPFKSKSPAKYDTSVSDSVNRGIDRSVKDVKVVKEKTHTDVKDSKGNVILKNLPRNKKIEEANKKQKKYVWKDETKENIKKLKANSHPFITTISNIVDTVKNKKKNKKKA